MNFFSRLLLAYLRLAAKLQLTKNPHAQIIGITGSSGKSSTREAIVAAIGDSFIVKHCQFGNSETGIPLDILGLKPHGYSILDWLAMMVLSLWKLLTNWEKFQIMVVEMGIDSPNPPKNMDYLLSIFVPQIGVLTNVSTVHGQNYDHLVDPKLTSESRHKAIKHVIAAEKGKLLFSLPKSGTAVFPIKLKFQLSSKISAHKFTFGSNSADLVIKSFQVTSETGTTCQLAYNHQIYNINLPKFVLSPAYANNLAAALAVAISLKLFPDLAVSHLQQNFHIPSGRMAIFAGKHHSHLIDSTYNASYESMQDSLQLLKLIKSKHKIAVLGDMREVGQSSSYDHAQILKLAESVTDQIILIGAQFKSLNSSHPSFLTADEAQSALQDIFHPNSLVLFKGSQNQIFLEYLLEKFLANPQDKQYLCRQSPYWQAVKTKFFRS